MYDGPYTQNQEDTAQRNLFLLIHSVDIHTYVYIHTHHTHTPDHGERHTFVLKKKHYAFSPHKVKHTLGHIAWSKSFIQ